MQETLRKHKAACSLAAAILLLIGSLLWLRPFWGLQDDGNFLPSADYFAKIGFWEGTKEVILGDLKWGMLRPYMALLIRFLYGWSKETTLYTHLLNILWVLGAHWLFYLSLLRSPIGRFYKNSEQETESIAVLMLLSLCVPWMHWYFLIPAMQEKVVLLWAAGSIFLLSTRRVREGGLAYFAFCAFTIAAVGMVTKAQFLVFGPLFVAVFWPANARKDYAKAALLLASFCAGGVFLKWISAGGNYTSGYGLSAIMENLRNTRALYPLTAACLVHIAAAWRDTRKNGRSWGDAYALASPALCLMAFLIIMLPWRLGGYLYAAIIPFLALMAGTWFFRFQKSHLAPVAFASMALLACVMTGYRAYKQWLPLADLRLMVTAARSGDWPADAKQIWNTCVEGHSHLNYYLHELAGRKDIEVLLANQTNIVSLSHANPSSRIYWIEQSEWCGTIEDPAVLDPASRRQELGGKWPSSMRLVSYEPARKK